MKMLLYNPRDVSRAANLLLVRLLGSRQMMGALLPPLGRLSLLRLRGPHL